MVLQCPDRGHDHHRVGLQPRHAALDVQKLLRPQIRAEARFRDGIVPQLQSHPGGGDGVAAVGDVGKGSAVDQGRSMLQRLNQIGLQSVLQQGRHGAGRLQVGSGHRGVVIGVAHHDPPQTGFQIRDVRCQTQHGHDLAGHGDIKSVLPGHTLHPAPQAIHDAAQLPVVHIHTPPPRNPLDVDPQGVTLLDVVVQHRRQQVVGRADGVKVPGEVEIDVLHRHHLGIAAAGGAALDAEHRPQGGLPQGHHGISADPPQPVRQPYRSGGLAFPGRGGGDSGHQNQLTVRPICLLQKAVVDLGFVSAVLLYIRPIHPAGVRNIRDGKGLRLLGDLDIAFDGHGCLLFSGLSVSRHPAVSCSIIPAPPGKSNSSLQIPLFSNLLQIKHRRRLLHSGLCVHVLCYL